MELVPEYPLACHNITTRQARYQVLGVVGDHGIARRQTGSMRALQAYEGLRESGDEAEATRTNMSTDLAMSVVRQVVIGCK
jgi:hypothetical protein